MHVLARLNVCHGRDFGYNTWCVNECAGRPLPPRIRSPPIQDEPRSGRTGHCRRAAIDTDNLKHARGKLRGICPAHTRPRPSGVIIHEGEGLKDAMDVRIKPANRRIDERRLMAMVIAPYLVCIREYTREDDGGPGSAIDHAVRPLAVRRTFEVHPAAPGQLWGLWPIRHNEGTGVRRFGKWACSQMLSCLTGGLAWEQRTFRRMAPKKPCRTCTTAPSRRWI